jgi:hypothetical protein
MADPVPPAWESDPLSTFLSDAQRNERVTTLNMPNVYALLRRMHAAFLRVGEITEKDNDPNLLPARLLMARARGAWLAAVRLGLSTESVETYPLVRVVVENAWYALHTAKDPNPPTRAQIWLSRDDSATAQQQCATEFSIANVRATHATLDPANAAAAQKVYKGSITFGGHPNERGVFAATVRTTEGFGAVILNDKPLVIAAALKSAIEAGVVALKTFALIYPERFKIMGVGDEIDALVGTLNTVFRQYTS